MIGGVTAIPFLGPWSLYHHISPGNPTGNQPISQVSNQARKNVTFQVKCSMPASEVSTARRAYENLLIRMDGKLSSQPNTRWNIGNLSSLKPFSLKRIWTHSEILLIVRLALLIFADLLWQNPLFHPSLAAAVSSVHDLVDYSRQLFLLVSKPTPVSSNLEALKQWLQRTCHENIPTSPVTKPTPRRPRLRKSFIARLRPCLCFGPPQLQNAATQF